MKKLQVLVVFAMILITLAILTMPIWLERVLPDFLSFLSSFPGKIGTMLAEMDSILKSFFEFVKNKI